MTRTRRSRFSKRLKRQPASYSLLQTVCIGAALAFSAFLLAIAVEWMARGSLQEAWSWAGSNPGIFRLNLYLALSVLLVFYSLIGSLFPSLAVSAALLFLFALISYFKTKLIGEPFFPWDVILNQEGMNIIPLVTGRSALLPIGAAAGAVLVLFLLRLAFKRYAVAWYVRTAFMAAAIVVLGSFALQSSWTTRLQYQAGVAQIIWNQQENYSNNGQLLAFTLNVKNSIISKPAGYGEAALSSIADNMAAKRQWVSATDSIQGRTIAEGQPTVGKTLKKAPNVIFIMNEAFWDPTLLPGITFAEDPIPTVRKLQQASATPDYMLSPQFGGGTSNVEFEVLTGLSNSFLPSGSVPYQQYISRPLPSLASFFESKGYKSLAVHSYEGWFWNRNNVYKWMGFEGFKSIDHFVEPEYRGAFISDEEVSRSIIREVEASEEPVFIYAVTMQNHGPYNDNRYGDASFPFEGNLTDEARQILNTYTLGARDADKSLKLLIDHFEQSGEPTYIVFYGDHMPMLGYDFDVYKQGGFIESSQMENWSLEDLRRMRSVPLVTWSNFPAEGENGTVISASFLGSYALNALGYEPPGQFAFGAELYRQVPGLLRNLTVDQDQNLSQAVTEEYKGLVDDYRLVQYDLMFGQQYLGNSMDNDYLNRLALPAYNIFDHRELQ